MTDCKGKPYPIFAKSEVKTCEVISGAMPNGSVFSLTLFINDSTGKSFPLPGQFFMLHPVNSQVLLARPISVYDCKKCENGFEVNFLILLKGKGTQELCSLRSGDQVQILGPLGNVFPAPNLSSASSGKKVLIVGGGIGVAPVAGFASSLKEKTYDFYASFKSGSYALENVKADKLVITTDDGSVGIKGMLPVALTREVLKNGNYQAVYACGPLPMLKYVKEISEEQGVQCWISMEARMACGMGVCLGCSIDTTEGIKRCCKEGPVFDSKIIKFPQFESSLCSKPVTRREPLNCEPDLSFSLKNVKFQNPLIGSSGTFGFGTEYEDIFDVNALGGISSKGLTLEPRQGNEGIRIWETPSGVMNSIGLQNPGIPHFIENELPLMMKLKPVAIANLSGSSLETYVEGARLLEKTDVPVIELNISCPNVAAGGAAFGMTCETASSVVSAVRKVLSKPLIVKLTPQASDLNGVALSCIKSGADAISLCNSFQGVAIDIERGVPVFDKIKAGFGGPAVRPIAMRLVYELCSMIKTLPQNEQVPVFAIGGAEKWQDVVEFIMCGAQAVQVGTATFANPLSMIECIDGLADFMKRKGYKTLDDLRGIALQ